MMQASHPLQGSSVYTVDIVTDSAEWEGAVPHVVALCVQAVERVLTMQKKAPCELTVLLTDDVTVKKLNAQFRGKDTPTNVLSFPSGDDMGAIQPPYLGDIALAFETVQKEAKEQDKRLEWHMQHLLVHGVLHLLGYDHVKEQDAGAMEALEVEILQSLGVSNPYEGGVY